MLLRNEREQASQQAKALRGQLVRAERQHGEAAAALGLQQLREEARRAEEAEAAAARVEGLEDEVRVARLAALYLPCISPISPAYLPGARGAAGSPDHE